MWDLETGARRQALWASHTPPLSQTQVCYLKNVKYVEDEKEYSQTVKTLFKTLERMITAKDVIKLIA